MARRSVHNRAIALIEYGKHAPIDPQVPSLVIARSAATKQSNSLSTRPALDCFAPLVMTRQMTHSLFDLSGKTAIVTGSSRGIGRAIAEEMAGARRQCRHLQPQAGRLRGGGRRDQRARPGQGGRHRRLHLRQGGVARTGRSARAEFGQIDVLVCNAASNPYYGPMGGITDDQFRKIMDNNVLSNHWLTSFVAPEMVERKSGSIIIVSSVGGLTSSTVIGAYNISKAADLQLVRNLAAEFGPSNVRVNAIAPGLVRTDFARALWENPDILKSVTKVSALKRIGEPREIAGAALFLASEAGSFVTGRPWSSTAAAPSARDSSR
jgi:NAD(P)-dependent dehydrogenase (short-subunit alcohol dehydrogenase family)